MKERKNGKARPVHRTDRASVREEAYRLFS